MIVEMLRLSCPPEQREAFLQRDAEVWTRGLMALPLFLGKEVWLDPQKPGQPVLVIHMESLAQLKAIPQAWIDGIEAAMGELKMPETSEIFEVARPDPRYQRSNPGPAPAPARQPGMIVEFLRIACPLEKREAFIERDHVVWTRGLMTQPGFLGKEVWLNPHKPDEVVLAIHMESWEHLRAIPREWCEQTDAAMGDLLMPLTAELLEVIHPDPRYRQAYQ
jgi:uncharacterized protein (TIGR03792 family)